MNVPRLSLLGLVVVIGCGAAWTYNSLARSQERVEAAWAQVRNVVQRRDDLIPALIEVTRAYAEHERSLLQDLERARMEYRAAATRAGEIEGIRRTEGELRRLFIIAEHDPELHSSRVFANLRHEMVGAENRIAIERARYNAAVREHRARVRRFPGRIFGGLFAMPDEL